QSSEHKTEPPNQRLAVGGLGRLQACFAQRRENETVDRMIRVSEALRLRVTNRLKCPMLLFEALVKSRSARCRRLASGIVRPRRSEGDPLLDSGDFLGVELAANGHFQAIMPDRSGQQAGGRVTGHNRRSSISPPQKRLAGIKS